ncbi:MAG TPA: helix-turn-helix domain-containing protein [Niabella sp.]|nr:helix-turn-helix domain-containing protein [Niabella sp.]
MDTLFIPNEGDFRRWIKDAVKECLENIPTQNTNTDQEEERLLNRKEIAGMFRISLVTLHEWMNRGLPFHKQGGRVYFIRSEVMEYVRQKKNAHFKIQEK